MSAAVSSGRGLTGRTFVSPAFDYLLIGGGLVMGIIFIAATYIAGKLLGKWP